MKDTRPSMIHIDPLLSTEKNPHTFSILAQDVSAAYPNGPLVLEKVNLKLPADRLIAVVGPNGGGKSTLCSLFMGILSPRTGRISIYGEPIKERHSHTCAYLPQSEQIDWDYPISVWSVVEGGRYGHMRSSPGLRRFLPPGLAGKEHAAIVEESLEAVAMLSHQNRLIGDLSGGEKKRVFLARALAQQARLLLLDEPFAGVDERSQDLIFKVLVHLRECGRTIIMVTHDMGRVYNYADLVVFIDGTVKAFGPPYEVLGDTCYTRGSGGRVYVD